MRKSLLAIPILACLCADSYGGAQPGPDTPEVPEHRLPWAGAGVTLRGDFHVHTHTSEDGDLRPDVIASKARYFGCDFIAITDHGDPPAEGVPTSEAIAGVLSYQQVQSARLRVPELMILYGTEWNFLDRLHASLVVAPFPGERELVLSFLDRFDAYRAETSDPLAAVAWLEQAHSPESMAIVINHPSRKRAPRERRLELAEFEKLLGSGGSLIRAFEAAPGHQKSRPPGQYRYYPTIDRFDPVVAIVNGIYDRFLHRGIDAGLTAGSDFHSQRGTYWPCQFSETFLHAPSRTSAGVLEALRHRSGFVTVGKILEDLDVTVTGGGIDPPARLGETVVVPEGSDLEVTIRYHPTAVDFEGSPNRIGVVQLLSNLEGSPAIQRSWSNPEQSVPSEIRHRLRGVRDPTGHGFYLRVRGHNQNRYWFYSSPIRVLTRLEECAVDEPTE